MSLISFFPLRLHIPPPEDMSIEELYRARSFIKNIIDMSEMNALASESLLSHRITIADNLPDLYEQLKNLEARIRGFSLLNGRTDLFHSLR
jgi:hypothetical protein